LSYPAPDGAETVQLPLGVTDKETYIRLALSLVDVSTTVYIHESLTPEEVLNLLVEHCKT
jgi:alpha-D-ribose 1-methylphosphonate 5-triphosphate synthase subunit PhnH